MANIGYSFASFDLNPINNFTDHSNIQSLGVTGSIVPSKLSKLFFGERNIRLIQQMIKDDIKKRSKGVFILHEDQDDMDLIVSMRYIYLHYSQFLDFDFAKQIKQLNAKLLNFIVPDMITNIKQQYGYLKDINEPIKPELRPLNVSSAGRKTLPSMTTVWK